MQVRAITAFASAGTLLDQGRLDALGAAVAALRKDLERSGVEVQSLRLATPPAEAWVATPAELPRQAAALEQRANAAGLKHVALGTLQPGPRQAAYLAAVPEVLRATQWVFASAELAGAHAPAYAACAESILANRLVAADGFANLRFAAAFGVPAFGPFFPAAWQAPDAPDGFALAIEGADLAVAAAADAGRDLDRFEHALTRAIDAQMGPLAEAARAGAGDLAFRGIDCALAPYPRDECSLGAAIEAVTGTAFGGPGTLVAVATVARAIRSAGFPQTGFCAPMLIVLEDSRLAARTLEGALGWPTVLACAAAGSCGPDVVALPGDTPPAALAQALRDVAALAGAVRRPLEMRVLPLAGQAAGARTEFSFSYFAPGAVLSL